MLKAKMSLKRHDSLVRKIAESAAKKRKPSNSSDSRLCGHCNENLCIKVYKKHERLYRRPDRSWILCTSTLSKSTHPEELVMADRNDGPSALPTFSSVSSCDKKGSVEEMDTNIENQESEDETDTSSIFSESEEDEVWQLSEEESDDGGVNVEASAPVPPNPVDLPSSETARSAQSLVRWIVGFLFILQSKYHLPNSAIDFLIKFISVILCIMRRFSPFIHQVQEYFPSSLYIMRQKLTDDVLFCKYPICPKCNRLYSSSEICIQKTGSRWSSKRCNHVEFPNHPQHSRRSQCNALLMKTVHLKSGQVVLYPFKVYSYRGLKLSLQKLLMRSSFVSECNHWRSRTEKSTLSDLYDGKVWKDFLQFEGLPFLQLPFTYGLMINIDWFQPYTHTMMSVGVIYLTIMNLPRTLRFKLENIIIIGIIPGPNEPQHDINSFLDPLVSELLEFWSGVTLHVNTSSGVEEKVVKCALLCIACDLPAARKVSGFLSYTARLGCSRCLKEFPGKVGEVRDFSGFDRSQWVPRTDIQHRDNVKKLKHCTNKAALKQTESEYGCRYSVLLDLPYFSPTRFMTIDPMHNLFLGTGKRMLSLWIEHDLVSRHHFEQIQSFVDTMVVPSDIGRIPSKISSGFSGFKADQFKVWITIYSIPALYHILPSDYFECWRHFVLACRILCKHSLSDVDINLADTLLIQFCKRTERLFGKSSITPNMHMHGHLKEVILDYGPLYEYWCYSFERMNGILGKQPTNNRAIEPQLLKQFLLDNASNCYEFPEEFKNDFTSLDLTNVQRSAIRGSVLDTITTDTFILPPKFKKSILSQDDIELLKMLYGKLNPHHCNVSINSVCKKFASITLKGKVYGSSGSKGNNPHLVLATWNEMYYGSPPTTLPDHALNRCSNERPVLIHHYISVVCKFSTVDDLQHVVVREWTFACVSWLFPHYKRYQIGKPAELWCSPNLTESFGVHSFLPLSLVITRCAYAPYKLDHDTLLVTVPL